MHSILLLIIREGPKYLLAAVIGVLVGDVLKAWRKKRFSIESARLPSFTLSIKGGLLEVRVFGKYSVLNLSDVPANLSHYNFMLYNMASRAFQCNLGRSNVPLGKWFEEAVIPPNAEVVLVSDEQWLIGVDRCWIRMLPAFLWLEILEHARIGSRDKLRYRARLYVRWYWSSELQQAHYRKTMIEIRARWARLLAVPGKLIHRYRGKPI